MDWAKKIRIVQAEWLKANRRVNLDDRGYTANVAGNLYILSPGARDEYRKGNGYEFGIAARPGKLAAPWSSSALVVNVFDDWRGRDLRPLARALGFDQEFTCLRFEAKFSTGFGGPANVDVVLEGAHRLAIEGKFCEPFEGGSRGKPRNSISRTYLKPENLARWQGLNALRELAGAVHGRRREYRRVDAPQLIKHTIALTRTKLPFELLHLWFSPGPDTTEAQEAAKELGDLGAAMQRDGVRFRSLTYQELFQRLKAEVLVGSPYIAYLQSRYFQEGKAVGPS
jgi:hypothetical protein